MIKPILFISLLAATATSMGCSSSTDSTGNGGSDGSGGGTVGTESAALSGHITKGSGSDAAAFGGPSAITSSSEVSAFTIDASGKPVSIGHGSVDANGAYSIDVPAGAGPTILEALDAKGNVVARAILEDVRVAKEKLTVQPMTTESSVEAAVLLAMAAQGTAAADIDAVGIRARIDGATAAVVQQHAADQASEANDDIDALASAVMAAQASEQAFLAKAGVAWTSYLKGELAAADTLTASLNGDASGSAKADAAFTSDLAALNGKLGLDAAASAAMAMDVSASARETLGAMSRSNDLTLAFARTEALVESAADAASMTEAFTKANASSTVMEALQAADTALVTHVVDATDSAALTSAFATWRTALRGTNAGAEGLLGKVLGTTITSSASYATTVTAILALDSGFQAALDASVSTAEGSDSIDASKLAASIAKAYASFDASVQSKVTGSLSLNAKNTALMTSVFIGAEGTFQGAVSGS
jgi:hypothetical protein